MDPCARFSDCSDCTAFNCFYCSVTDTCSTNRISSDCTGKSNLSDLILTRVKHVTHACLASCPSNSTTPVYTSVEPSATPDNNSTVIGDTPSSTAIGEGDANAQQATIQKVVPAVVVSGAAVIAGVVVLVVLLKRRQKKKQRAVQVKVPLQRMNSRTMSQRSMSSRGLNRNNTSKYGIERNTINSNPDKTWEPPAESEFAEVDKMPFDMSKKIDFNVGSNQFKVGQQYTDVITITAKDKVRHSTPSAKLANLALY